MDHNDRNSRIRQRLDELAEPEFCKFSAGLIPGEHHIIGVRLPVLRRYAGQLAKGDWQTYLKEAADDSMEEILLQGMVLGYARTTFEELKPYLNAFIPKINNWSVCDSTCNSLKIAVKEPEAVYSYLQPYLHSGREFEMRFAVVMLLSHFITDPYIDRVLAEMDTVRHEGYYVKMAAAWNLSVCFVKFREKTIKLLEENHLDDWTYNKAIQKMLESRCVSAEDKALLRSMKRK